MRKLIFLFSLLFLFQNISIAQIFNSWGIKGGLLSSNQDWHSETNIPDHKYDNRYGLAICLFSEFLNLHYFNITTELSYLQIGIKDDNVHVTKIANNSMGYEDLGTLNYRFDYLSILLLAKLKYNFDTTTPYLILGPRINYLIGANEQADLIKDKFNKSDFAFTIGLGTELSLNIPITLIGEIRYSQDITDSYKSDDLSIKSRYFEFLLGVKF